jgi:hypothetical protein
MTDKVITKADLARELNLSRARISQLCHEGLPVRPDGKLNRTEVLSWVKRYCCPYAGGWGMGLRAKEQKKKRQRAPMPEASMAECGMDFELPQIELGDLPEIDLKDLKDLEIPDLEEEARKAAYRQLLDRAVRASEVLPEVLLSMGVRDMGLVHAAADLFTAILFHVAGPFGDAAYDWAANDDFPVVAPKYAELAKRFGVEYDVDEAEKRADELCDGLYQRLNELEDHEE